MKRECMQTPSTVDEYIIGHKVAMYAPQLPLAESGQTVCSGDANTLTVIGHEDTPIVEALG